MKDAYTFDRDRAGLDASYQKHVGAYDRIFDRLGLEWYSVESDVGMMGGFGAHEYMAPCAAGEDDVALAPGYAANVEIASAEPQPVELPRAAAGAGARGDARAWSPWRRSRASSACPRGALLKAYPVIVGDGELRLVMLRGDHRVNEIKLQNALGAEFRPARAEEFEDRIGPAGYIGPVGTDVPILLDRRRRAGRLRHRREPARRAPARRRAGPRLRASSASTSARSRPATPSAAHPIRIEPAIEVGNIFKLGTRFSEPLGATLPRRVRRRAADLDGLLRARARRASPPPPSSSSPTSTASPGRARSRRSTSSSSGSARRARRSASSPSGSTSELRGDRARRRSTTTATPARATKFADAELLGVPLRLTVGRRTLEAGEIEAQVRRGREQRSVPLEGAAEAAADLWRSLP